MNDKLNIELQEYQSVSGVPLTVQDTVILQKNFQKAVSLKMEPEGSYSISASSWVGRISLPSVEILIQPKLPVSVLWNWLVWAQGIKKIRWSPPSGFGTDWGDAEWLIRFFIRACEQIVAIGLKKDYISVDEVIPAVKGTLQAASTSGRWLKYDYRFDCRYDEYTSWVDENRCIYAGLQSMSKRKMKDPNLLPKLKALMGVFGQERTAYDSMMQESDQIGKRLLARIKPNRLNLHYSESFQWLKLYWDGASLADSAGGVIAQSFLLDMNELYEAYIAARLKDALHPYGITVLEQQQDSLAVGGRIRIIPDLIIRDTHGREIIADTKYKQKFDDASINSDVFQMLAYLTARKANTAVLLYASGPEREDRLKNTGHKILQWSMKMDSVGYDPTEEEMWLSEIVGRMLRLFGSI